VNLYVTLPLFSKKAVLSQGEPRDAAAVNFDTYHGIEVYSGIARFSVR